MKGWLSSWAPWEFADSDGIRYHWDHSRSKMLSDWTMTFEAGRNANGLGSQYLWVDSGMSSNWGHFCIPGPATLLWMGRRMSTSGTLTSASVLEVRDETSTVLATIPMAGTGSVRYGEFKNADFILHGGIKFYINLSGAETVDTPLAMAVVALKRA